MFLIDTPNHVDALVVVDEAVWGVSRDREVAELEDLGRTAPEDKVGVNDSVVFGSSDYVDVTVGDYDGFGVVRKVLELLKLLNFVVFVLDVVQKAVVLLNRKYR